jgi:hypothetical protein
MAERDRDTTERRGSEPLAAADSDKIDQAAEPETHPDAAGQSVADEAGELLERVEGNSW